MKCKVLTAVVSVLLVLMICVGALSAFATGETVPSEAAPTETVTETVPTESVVSSETLPSGAETTVPTGSDVTVPSETGTLTDPTETTVPVTRGTEFAESQPEDQTHSPYNATNSPIQAPSYNANKENWGHIDYEDLGIDTNVQSGKIDFSGVQNDTSTEDKRSYFLTNIAVVLLILAIIGITVFVLTFVFEANKKKAGAEVSSKKTSERKSAGRKASNHYRDGF